MIKWLVSICFLVLKSESAVICPRYLNVVPVQAVATPNDRLCCGANTPYQDMPQILNDSPVNVATYLQTHINNGMLVSNKMEILSHQGTSNVVESNIRVQNYTGYQNQQTNMIPSPQLYNSQYNLNNNLNNQIQSSTTSSPSFTPISNDRTSYNQGGPLSEQYLTTHSSQFTNEKQQFPSNTAQPNTNGQSTSSAFRNNDGSMYNAASSTSTFAATNYGYKNSALGNGNVLFDGQSPILSTSSTGNGFTTTSTPYFQNQQTASLQSNMNANAGGQTTYQNTASYANIQQDSNINSGFPTSTPAYSPNSQTSYGNNVQSTSSSNYFMSTQNLNVQPNNNNVNNRNTMSPTNVNPIFSQNDGVNYVPSTTRTLSSNGYSTSSPNIMTNMYDPNRGQIQSTTALYPTYSNSQEMPTGDSYSQSTLSSSTQISSAQTTNLYNPSNPILSASSIPPSYIPNEESIDQFPSHVLYDSQRMLNTQFGDYTNAKRRNTVTLGLIAVSMLNIII